LAEARGRLRPRFQLAVALRDLYGFRLPERERVDRSCRPLTAGIAVAIAHAYGLASHRQLNLPAKTAAVIGFLVVHVVPREMVAAGAGRGLRHHCSGISREIAAYSKEGRRYGKQLLRSETGLDRYQSNVQEVQGCRWIAGR